MADQGIDAIVSEVDQTLRDAVGSESALVGHVTDDPALHRIKSISQIPQMEDGNMPDLDLSGDDLKYVSYSIIFTKRDYETTLQHEKQEIVDYATDGGSYGGLKIAEFFEKVARGDVPRPALWETSYAPLRPVEGQPNKQTWLPCFPREDRKYVKFIYRVDRHLPKGEADYEKQQVKVLREIRDRIR